MNHFFPCVPLIVYIANHGLVPANPSCHTMARKRASTLFSSRKPLCCRLLLPPSASVRRLFWLKRNRHNLEFLNRRASQTICHLRIIFTEATRVSRDNRVLPPSLHNHAIPSRVLARRYFPLRTGTNVHRKSQLPRGTDGMVFG